MASIEDILYEAHYLGITDTVFKKLKKLKGKEKHKFTDLNSLYTKAFNKSLKKFIKKNSK